jgi:flagellar basal-body rod protein FlgB
MDFAKALREATGRQGGGTSLSMARPSGVAAGRLDTTQSGHIRTGGATSDANLLYSTASQPNLDNNTVDMDRERASFADNAIKYEATLGFINGSVKTMLDSIKGTS